MTPKTPSEAAISEEIATMVWVFDAGDERRDRVRLLASRVADLEARLAVLGGEFCAESRAKGRDACGCCSWCVKNAQAERDRARAELAAARHDAESWKARYDSEVSAWAERAKTSAERASVAVAAASAAHEREARLREAIEWALNEGDPSADTEMHDWFTSELRRRAALAGPVGA